MTLPKCRHTPENRTLRVRSRIERRFETLVNNSVAMLPGFLADCESHVAARLITDLLAIYLSRPAPDSNTPDCLSCLLEQMAEDQPEPPAGERPDGVAP